MAALVLQVCAGKVPFVPAGPDRTQVRSVFFHMIGSLFVMAALVLQVFAGKNAFRPTRARSHPGAICIFPCDWILVVMAAFVWQMLAFNMHFVPPGPDRTQVRSVFCHMILSLSQYLLAGFILSHQGQIAPRCDLHFSI